MTTRRVGWFLLYLAVFYGTFFIVGFVAVWLFDVDTNALGGLAVLAAIIYIARMMPGTGRSSLWALGLIIPFVNAYLFFGTFWRLAGLRSGDITAYDLTKLTSGRPPVLYPKGKEQQDKD